MCTCEHPTINGQPGYRWQPKDRPSIYPVNPPELHDDDEVVYDLPGRCGRGDSHSHHFMVIKRPLNRLCLRARHGGGDESYTIGTDSNGYRPGVMDALKRCSDDNERYWLIQALYHTLRNVRDEARNEERETWKRAAREGRLKIRSRKGQKYAQILD